MKRYCKTCDVPLELVKSYEPWWEEFYQCPICNGTYNIEEQTCKCKYAHHNEKCKWPTLEGRLNQPLTSEKEALLQMYRIGGVTMSEEAIRKVEKYLEEDKQLQEAKRKVQFAVDNSPKVVSFEEAKKQVERFRK